jgi:hypothetical protein
MAREHNPDLPDGAAIHAALRRLFAEQLARFTAWLQRTRSLDARAAPLMPDPRDDTPQWVEAMTPLLTSLWDEAARKFLESIDLDPDAWQVTNPHTQAAIQRQALDFAGTTNATSKLRADQAREATRQALIDGLIGEGETTNDLARRVRQIFEDDGRALRIADTEAKRAHNAATIDAGETSSVVVGWKWLLSSGACPACHAVAAQVNSVAKGQPFAVGVGTHEVYSTVKHPPLHPWCACTITAILDHQHEDHRFNPPITGKQLQEAVKAALAAEKKAAGGEAPPVKPPPAKKTPVPKPPAFPASKAAIETGGDDDRKRLAKTIKNVFGKKVALDRITSAIGALDDTLVHLEGDGDSRISYKVQGDRVITWHGRIERFKDQITHHFDRISLQKSDRQKRAGTLVHGRIADWGSRLGIDHVELAAAHTEDDVGYVVWPIFGYDTVIQEASRGRLPESLRRFATIQDLLGDDDGRDWWAANGFTMKMTFALASGSPNQRHWARYWAGLESAIKKGLRMDKTRKKLSDMVDLEKNNLGLPVEDLDLGWELLGKINAEIKAEAARGADPVKRSKSKKRSAAPSAD